jgi:preprotein translocase subunit SecE
MCLQLAQVGDVLIICGTEKAIEPFRKTAATFLVDSVEEYKNIFWKMMP